jgi:hypothetical protein
MSQIYCENGHELVELSLAELRELYPDEHRYVEGYRCDNCQHWDLTSSSYHCQLCSYDICPHCAVIYRGGETSIAFFRAQKRLCTHLPNLVLKTVRQLAEEDERYAERYNCDECHENFDEGASYHCHYCSYDLCPMCAHRIYSL